MGAEDAAVDRLQKHVKEAQESGSRVKSTLKWFVYVLFFLFWGGFRGDVGVKLPGPPCAPPPRALAVHTSV